LEDLAVTKLLTAEENILIYIYRLVMFTTKISFPNDSVGAKINKRLNIFLKNKFINIFQFIWAIRNSSHFIQVSIKKNVCLQKSYSVDEDLNGSVIRTVIKRSINNINGVYGNL
jgi:hypothetical protein